MKNYGTQHKRFPGFKGKYTRDFFTYPTVLENYWHQLSGTEQKALDFILRQTLGFQRTSDQISISQFVTGIGERNKGAGLSKATVLRVLKSLEEKGFVRLKKTKFHTTEISLAPLHDNEDSETPTNDVTSTSQEVLVLIEMFRNIAPHQTDDFKTNKKQIEAMSSLLRYYSAEQIGQAIQLAHMANRKKYAPTITSPVELSKKWVGLETYVRKYQDKESNGFSVML